MSEAQSHLYVSSKDTTPKSSSSGADGVPDSALPAPSTEGLQPEAWDSVVELIGRSHHILVVSHVSPDGDAIGSMLGLGLALRALGKSPILACESPVPLKLNFLPAYETIVDRVDPAGVELIVGLDCSDTARFGTILDDAPSPHLWSELPLINIDHHVTNLYFGDVNLVDPKAASTAELILTLLDHLGISLEADNGDIATCLLTGIVTDTLGFRTSNVTPQVMKAAMRLMTAGASLAEITYYAFNQRPVVELSLLARGLSQLQIQDGLGWSQITLADRRAVGHQGNGDAGLVGMLVRTREVQVAAVFAEKQDDKVEISFRAAVGYDVSQLALRLGGGGHPAAAGCTVEGSLEAVQARVLPMLQALVKEQRAQQ